MRTVSSINSALIGFSARPTDAFRVSFDTQFFSADNTYTRITPRQFQIYKVRASYHDPKGWFSLGSAVNIHENRNNTVSVGNLQHNRSYAFNGADFWAVM